MLPKRKKKPGSSASSVVSSSSKGLSREAKQAVVKRAEISKLLENAAQDFAAIQLSRRKEAEAAKQRIIDLAHPLELRPDSEWQPTELKANSIFYKVLCADVRNLDTWVHA